MSRREDGPRMDAAAPPLGQSLDRAPMSRRHLRFWLLAGLGIMLDGFDLFIIGVANPLIAEDFGPARRSPPSPHASPRPDGPPPVIR